MDFKIDEIRDLSARMSGLTGIDDKLTFYYDETNNIRKYYLREAAFNESIRTNFVLGGIVLEENQSVDLQPLFDSFKLQKNITDVKLKHLAKGNFVNSLNSSSLNSIFDFLSDNNLHIHYSALNFLYFSLVDLIDSLIAATGIEYHPFYNRALKNDLYLCAKQNIEKFIDIFFRYSYPNIKPENATQFLNELIEIFSNEPKSKGRDTILMLLNKSLGSDDLVFIMNEPDHVLIENFAHFYFRSLYIFVDAIHFFDQEDSIEPLLKDLNMNFKGKPLVNYAFIDSKDNRLIQLSDILIGFIGKFFSFINENNLRQIEECLRQLTKNQQNTLKGFLKILSKSEMKNRAFIFLTVSNDELEKMNFIQDFF